MAGPQIGQIEDGYEYVGGDPASQSSWRPVGGGAVEDGFYFPSAQPTGPKTIQEQHDAVSWKDRLVLQNLASSPEAKVKYLAKEHPELEIVAEPSGQIKMKRPDEDAYRVLDPDTGFFSGLKEMAQDVGDIGYDVLSGLGTSAATAAAGLGGGLSTAGVGALPAAAGAGAATSAGFEAARQGLGSAFGLEDNIDPTQIGLAGLAGGVSPLLFGTGATAAQVAKKGLTGDAAEALLKSQRGLPAIAFEKGIKAAGPRVGGFLSGTPAQTVRDLQDNLKDVARFGDDELALKNFVEEQAKANIDKMDETTSGLYKQFQKHIEKNVGDGVLDVSDAAKAMSDEIDDLASKYRSFKSGDNKQKLEDALQAFNDVWGGKPSKTLVDGKLVFNPTPYKIKADELKSLTTSIQDLANFGERFQFGTVKPKSSDLLERMGDKTYVALKDSVERAAEGAGELRGKLAKAMQDKKEIYKEFTPKKVLEKSQQFASSKVQSKAWAQRAKEFDKIYGTNYDKLRGTVAASNAFSKDVPLISGKRIPAAVLGGLGGVMVGRATSGQSDSGGWAPGLTGGAALGALLGGPRALRALIEASRSTGGGGMLSPARQALMPTWNIMQTSNYQEGK